MSKYFTSEWLREYQTRQMLEFDAKARESVETADAHKRREILGKIEKETDLHNAIIDECERRDWCYFHGAMCRRTARTLGEPDFIIIGGGRVWFIECKTRTGKLSTEQQSVAAHLRRNGAEHHTVRSPEEFMELTKI